MLFQLTGLGLVEKRVCCTGCKLGTLVIFRSYKKIAVCRAESFWKITYFLVVLFRVSLRFSEPVPLFEKEHSCLTDGSFYGSLR